MPDTLAAALLRLRTLPPDVAAAEEIVRGRGWSPSDLARRIRRPLSEVAALLAVARAAREAVAAARDAAGNPGRRWPAGKPRARDGTVDLALEGYTPSEIAAELGIPAARVSSRLHAGRRAGVPVPTFPRGKSLPL